MRSTRVPQQPTSTLALDLLVTGIDEIVHERPDANLQAIAQLTSQAVREPGLLAPRFRRSSPDGYRTNIVHVADDGSFSIVALVWLPGQGTPIHSHRSWCVVGIHEGDELETSYDLEQHAGDRRLRRTSTRRSGPGAVSWLGSTRNIHQVENPGDSVAISIHVYGIDYRRFGSSILDVFDPAQLLPVL